MSTIQTTITGENDSRGVTVRLASTQVWRTIYVEVERDEGQPTELTEKVSFHMNERMLRELHGALGFLLSTNDRD